MKRFENLWVCFLYLRYKYGPKMAKLNWYLKKLALLTIAFYRNTEEDII